VAVVGAGAIGLLAQRIAGAAGSSTSAVIAASTAKDEVVHGDPRAQVHLPTDVDDVGADVVIEATGAAAGIDLAVRAAAPGGTVVLLGTTRAETVAFPLAEVEARGLQVVGAHAGLLDVPGGMAGLDRRAAAQRFLDRLDRGAVRVGDMLTARVDPVAAAAFYDHLAGDRRQVVPVLDWWRLPLEQRIRAGALAFPNPFRRALDAPLAAGVDGDAPGPEAEASPIVEHPQAPPRPAPAAGARGGDDAALTAAVLAVPAVAAAGSIRVAGTGATAEAVRKAVADRGVLAGDGSVDVVIDLDPTGESVAAALSSLGPAGTLVVAGAAGAVDVDVQTLVHRRGTTVVGAGWHDG
jgi:threonine dehydrogenase-like Zn-dependent dehydrogenase